MTTGRRIKNALKQALKFAVGLFGLFWPFGPSRTRILTYHSVGYRSHEMNVLPEDFAAQMAWLAEHHSVISLEDAAQAKPGIAITFDDGYVDNLENAAPILVEHAFPATVFMVAGRAEGTLDDDPHPEDGQLMNWDQLRKLDSMGITIGSHTMTHPHLSQQHVDIQQNEIEASKAILENELAKPVTIFAYPYGSALDYDEVTTALVKSAGYTLAVSNRYGPIFQGDDPFTLRRIWIDSTDTMKTFAAKVDGRMDGLRILDSGPGIAVRRLLNRGLGTR
mgnify:CR=1 FL=1